MGGDRSRFLPSFDRFAAACRLAADFDEVAVHELAVGETVIAIMVTFEVAGRVSLYQSARMTDFRWRDATTVLLTAIIADACDRGFAEVDFLRGDEAYKNNLAPQRRDLLRLRGATGRTGRVALAADTAARKARLAAARSVRSVRSRSVRTARSVSSAPDRGQRRAQQAFNPSAEAPHARFWPRAWPRSLTALSRRVPRLASRLPWPRRRARTAQAAGASCGVAAGGH